jgi:hypothetical protein
VIHFSSLTWANEIALYNAILLVLMKLGSEVIGPTFNPTVAAAQTLRIHTNDALLFPGEVRDAQEVAIEICKSVHYHLLDHHSSAGAFYLLFPLYMAFQAFAPASREAGWLQAMMMHIANLSGFEISRELRAQTQIKYAASETAYADLT